MTAADLAVRFFLQAAIIVLVSRIVGSLVQKYLGQPRVVGEMIAGVTLGPSLFGAAFPNLYATIFPADSLKVLFVFAQFGVGIYMFVVGLGFDKREFGRQARSAAAVSAAGMISPFLAAMALVPWLEGFDGIFGARVSTAQATLFLGAAIAITAFPMLARIIHERGISNTPTGTLALAAGAIGDAGAWIVLSIVLATLTQDPLVAIKALGGGTAFALFMIFLAPKLLSFLQGSPREGGAIQDGRMTTGLILFLLCAWAMDAVGIHAVFGGFLLGTAMPRGEFAEGLRQRIEPLANALFLPLFFAYSGLNTELLLIFRPDLLAATLAILIAAIAAKGGACYVAARLSGQTNRISLGIGALMNARGLMELIIINIGLQRGVIGPALFAILVLTAIVTTLMASPLFDLAQRSRGSTSRAAA